MGSLRLGGVGGRSALSERSFCAVVSMARGNAPGRNISPVTGSNFDRAVKSPRFCCPEVNLKI